MNFAQPEMLWLLATLVPLLALFYWWAWRKRQELIRRFVQSRLLASLTVGISNVRQKARMALMVVAVVFIILTLARPQWGFTWEEVKQRGIDIIVAIDTSRSMLAQDLAPNRLERAKLAALDLMKLSYSDRLGLVAFSGTAFLQCPLTLDDEAFRQSVMALNTDIIPQGGTALSEAIQAAQEGFGKSGDNHKVLVIFTDGEDHDGEALTFAKAAADVGIIIYTIGVGSPEGDLLRISDEKGNRVYLKDDEGNVVKSRLNQTLLLQIASEAKGFYLPLAGAKTVDKLYEEGLGRLPKSDHNQETRFFKRYAERFQWPLAIAILVLIFEMFFPQRKRDEKSATVQAGTNAELQKAVMLWLLLLVPIAANASPATARKEYEKGSYKSAEQEYQRLLKEKPGDPRLHYNAGAAAFRDGRFEDAARNFESALLTPDIQLQERAYYNRGNALYRQGEADAERKGELWEDAIQNYERALKLKSDDTDAKHNLEFVKKKLEELKQQQEQQKDNQKQDQDQKKDDENKDEKENDKKDDQKQENQKGDQQKKQDQQKQKDQQSEKQDKQDQSKGDQEKENSKDNASKQNDDNQKKEKQNQEGSKKDETQAGQQGSKNEKGEKGDKEQQGQAMQSLGALTPEQAMQLLDAQKGEEKALIFLPPSAQQQKQKDRKLKDW